MKQYRYKVLRTVLESCEVVVFERALRPGETPAEHAIAKGHVVDKWTREWADYEVELLSEVPNGRD